MKITFCNITYMNYYMGNIVEDMPKIGGEYVADDYVCDEKCNFINVNNKFYGAIENKGANIDLSELGLDGAGHVDGVCVVWCAKNKDGKTVIVGWYNNASAYSEMQQVPETPMSGIDHRYYFKADAKDSYLLPIDLRDHEVDLFVDDKCDESAAVNYLAIDTEKEENPVASDVLNYIDNYQGMRINIQPEQFDEPADMGVALTEEQFNEGCELYQSGQMFEFLPYAYRCFGETGSVQHAYGLATTLKNLHQYDRAIEWYNKVIEIEGPSWDILGEIAYMHVQCEHPQKAIETATKSIELLQEDNSEFKCEMYSIMFDSYSELGQMDESIAMLDKIIETSQIPEQVEYIEDMKAEMLAGK